MPTLEVLADDATTEPPASMIERTTLILDVFDRPALRLRLEEVAHRTRLPRSTVHRILDQLVRLSWLEKDGFHYCLGHRALGLGGYEQHAMTLRAATAPVLQRMMIHGGGVAHLGVLHSGRVLYLDKLGGRFAVALPSRVGGYAPAHSTALGKAMLACLPPERVESLVGRQMHRLTDNTIVELRGLHQELGRVRGRGSLAFERGECLPGVACVAAAITDVAGRPIGAVSLAGYIDAPLERLAPLVLSGARRVSAQLARRRGAAPGSCSER